jgi:NADH-quinone oxidoreductase subunit E
LAQKELGGRISLDAELDIADKLDVPPTRVREVVTFYTMFYDKAVGRNVVKICRNLSCQMRGADRIMDRAKEILGIEFGETTADGRVTLEHEECLASCGTGPMLWCNEAFVENLTEEKLESFLAGLK